MRAFVLRMNMQRERGAAALSFAIILVFVGMAIVIQLLRKIDAMNNENRQINAATIGQSVNEDALEYMQLLISPNYKILNKDVTTKLTMGAVPVSDDRNWYLNATPASTLFVFRSCDARSLTEANKVALYQPTPLIWQFATPVTPAGGCAAPAIGADLTSVVTVISLDNAANDLTVEAESNSRTAMNKADRDRKSLQRAVLKTN